MKHLPRTGGGAFALLLGVSAQAKRSTEARPVLRPEPALADRKEPPPLTVWHRAVPTYRVHSINSRQRPHWVPRCPDGGKCGAAGRVVSGAISREGPCVPLPWPLSLGRSVLWQLCSAGKENGAIVGEVEAKSRSEPWKRDMVLSLPRQTLMK